MIRASGVEPQVIEYLRTPPDRATIVKLVADAGLKVRQALRQKDTPYEALRLGDPGKTDDELLDAMGRHPILLNRPFVVTPIGTRLCRPSEVVLQILENPDTGPFAKEDGEMVVRCHLALPDRRDYSFCILAPGSPPSFDVAVNAWRHMCRLRQQCWLPVGMSR